ncbi:unnamed protein product [Angiostrongylus costaricensis]|uniref:Secreted protein n=1 Tax=Angiostrongylus costaricensis TaxID=334426 RepID=A0A0R3PDV8_ANGCS|nr:unnamed protein product [Angiostrongylus costaricensis]
MRLLVILVACSSTGYAYENKNPLKTKKYKCLEVDDEMEIQIVPKQVIKGKAMTVFQRPLRKENRGRPIVSQKAQDIPRDKEGRQLLLSPTHCKQVKHYASSYGVSDVLSWVERNCSFAKMFLPTATCEEINTLVASCYKFKFI